MEFKYYERTPITDGVEKKAHDLSINVSVKFIWLYWAFEYLKTVSKYLKKLTKDLTCQNIIDGSLTQVSTIDKDHVIEFMGKEVNTAEEMKKIINEMENFNSQILYTIKLKVTLKDFLLFNDMVYIGYIRLSDEGVKREEKFFKEHNISRDID